MQDKIEVDDAGQITASVSTTSCRQCVFAEYEDNAQAGCGAGRFEVFEDNGVDLIYVQDDEKAFYLVKDKGCPYFRHADSHGDILKNHSMQELKELVSASLKIPYHALLFLRKEDTLEDLKKRLSELESQSVKPKIISVIDRTHSEIDMTPKIVGLFHNHYSFEHWRTQRVVSTDNPDMSIVDVCYDNTKSIKYFFYIIFEASKPIPSSFSEEIHHSIQEKMQSFVLLEPNGEGNGKTVLKIAHAKYAGHSFDVDIKDKLIHYDDGVHLIRKVEDVCPSLRTS